MGYTNVKDYEGGKSDWMEAGFPVEGEESGAGKSSSETQANAPRPAEVVGKKPETGATNTSTSPEKDVA